MAVVRENSTGVNMGETVAPKAVKLTDLFSRISSQGTWSGQSLEYLKEIRQILEDPSMPNKAEMTYLSDDAVAFSIGKNSIVLVRDTDMSNIQALANDTRLYAARNTFNEIMKDHTLLNIVSVNRFMYNRAPQMATYIRQTLSAITDDQISGLVLDNFEQYQVNIDTEMSNVREFFNEHSPSPVIAGDFGFIAGISEKMNKSYGAPLSKSMFGVTGYVEFIQNEADSTYTPVVHVTDILSVMASTKMLAIALPLIADVFITRGLWRYPFSSFGKADVNIGNLIVDYKTQKPATVSDAADMRKMISQYINSPILCIDVKSGSASITGLTMLTRAADHPYLAGQIYNFLNVGMDSIPPTIQIGEGMFREIVGVLETGKSRIGANLTDTRDLNYLNLVSKLGWSPQLEALKTRYEADPTKRWTYISELVKDAGMIPTHNAMSVALYGDFVTAISTIVAAKLAVSVPSLTTTPSINLGGLAAKSFTPGSSLFSTPGVGAMSGGFLRF